MPRLELVQSLRTYVGYNYSTPTPTPLQVDTETIISESITNPLSEERTTYVTLGVKQIVPNTIPQSISHEQAVEMMLDIVYGDLTRRATKIHWLAQNAKYGGDTQTIDNIHRLADEIIKLTRGDSIGDGL